MVRNVHERLLNAPATRIGELLDTLASANDGLWPRDRWPAMRFDRPLQVGAVGGHGPIRYTVEAYEPERMIRFRFSAPRGFIGWHGCTVEAAGDGYTLLRHTLEMRLEGPALLTWPLVFRPLHDALIEDALDRAEAFAAGRAVAPRAWSGYVVLLRRLLARRTAARTTA